MDLQFTWLATWEDCGVIIYLARYLRRLWIYNDLQFTWLAIEDCGFTIYLARYLGGLWIYNLPDELSEKTVKLQFTWFATWEDGGFTIYLTDHEQIYPLGWSSPRRTIWEACGFTIYLWNCSGFENIEAHLMKLRFTIGFRGIPTNTMEYYPTSKFLIVSLPDHF